MGSRGNKGTTIEQHDGPLVSVTPMQREMIASARALKGWTQKQLATKAGTTSGTISNLESKSTQVRQVVFSKVLKALKLDGLTPDIAELIEETIEALAKLTPANTKRVRDLAVGLASDQPTKSP